MQEPILTFIDSAVEAFGIQGPIYHIGPHDPMPCAPRPADCEPTDCEPTSPLLGIPGWTTTPPRDTTSKTRLPLADQATSAVLCTGTWVYQQQSEHMAGEIRRVLAPGGLLLLCTLTEEGTDRELPADWHPTPHSLHQLLVNMAATLVVWHNAESRPRTLYGVGINAPATASSLSGIDRFSQCFEARLKAEPPRRGWKPGWRPGWKRRLGRLLTPRKWAGVRRDDLQVHSVVHFSAGSSLSASPHDCSPSQQTGGRIDLIE